MIMSDRFIMPPAFEICLHRFLCATFVIATPASAEICAPVMNLTPGFADPSLYVHVSLWDGFEILPIVRA